MRLACALLWAAVYLFAGECGEGEAPAGVRARQCDAKEWTLPATSHVQVDARYFGGVKVFGWERNEIFLQVKLTGWADSEEAARRIINQVAVQTDGGIFRSTRPDLPSGGGYDVSWEMYVPSSSDLTVQAYKGDIAVSQVRGRMRLDTITGAIRLDRTAGDVAGKTVNGDVVVDLEGDGWKGVGLDLKTSVGGVQVQMSPRYSGFIDIQTKSGDLKCDLPIHSKGSRVQGPIGHGATPIRIATGNGNVTIARKRT